MKKRTKKKRKVLRKAVKSRKGYYKLGKRWIPLRKRLDFKRKTWKALQTFCAKRDGGKICCNKNANCYGAMHLHHKKPLGKGGTNRPGNLAWICHLHHCIKHPWMIKDLIKKAGY